MSDKQTDAKQSKGETGKTEPAAPKDGAGTSKSGAGGVPLHGLIAEYETPGALLSASKKVRDAGFKNWDTYTPFPVHGIDGAMGIKPTVLPWIVLGAGLTGLATGILLQWWTNTYDYPYLTSGKPMWSLPAHVPVMFELMVLFSAITALVAMLALNGLPEYSHPLDLKKYFARATDDRFFLVIQANDPRFAEDDAWKLLEGTHPTAIDRLEEDRVTPANMPRPLVFGLVLVVLGALVPFALIARARVSTSEKPRIHIIPDMDFQEKFKSQRMNPVFEDKRAMRPELEGTVAVGALEEDDHLYRGKLGDEWAREFPAQIPISDATMKRGQQEFGVFCAPCHGQVGHGDGMVNDRAVELAQGTWVPASDITQEYLRKQPVGELFNTITHGIRNMPPYGPQISPEDRWAIVLYVRALQRSRGATIQDVPEADRGSLK